MDQLLDCISRSEELSSTLITYKNGGRPFVSFVRVTPFSAGACGLIISYADTARLTIARVDAAGWLLVSTEYPDPVISGCSPIVAQLFCYSGDFLLGKSLRLLFGPTTDEAALQHLTSECLAGRPASNRTEAGWCEGFLRLDLYRAGGRRLHTLLSAQAVLGDGDSCVVHLKLRVVRLFGPALHIDPNAARQDLSQHTVSETDSEPAGPLFHAVVEGRVYVAHGESAPPDMAAAAARRIMAPPGNWYTPLCDDFGPPCLSAIAGFVSRLDAELSAAGPAGAAVVWVKSSRRAVTNAVFLAGAYAVLQLGQPAAAVARRVEGLEEHTLQYRDAAFSPPTFGLCLADCWRALERARDRGWFRVPGPPPRQLHSSRSGRDDGASFASSRSSTPGPGPGPETAGSPDSGGRKWGEVDLEEYDAIADPARGDMHVMIPGRLAALRGPVDSPQDGQARPSEVAAALRRLGAVAVVRLNDAEYDAATFEAAGLRCHALEFPDCTAPPGPVVRAFFAIMDAAAARSAGGPRGGNGDGRGGGGAAGGGEGGRGLVGVHCKAGLGRTGTLVALELMRTEGFAAREAMAWVRLVRPGSVVGEQQHFLCDAELRVREAAAAGAEGGGGGGAEVPVEFL